MNKSRFASGRAVVAIAVFCASALAVGAAVAQVMPQPQNVLQLSSTGTVDVQQDLLSLSLTTSRDGADANAVQTQLKTALDAALTEARKSAQPGQLDVRTGQFNLGPRYSPLGKISGWQGTAELVLEGRDFPRITQTAARIQSMTLGNVSFGLSREARAKVESDAQTLAIERFKTRAGELARGFGFTGYTLREVSVNSGESGYPPPRIMAMQAKGVQAEMAVPVEAGKSSVVVTVSGSVQLK